MKDPEERKNLVSMMPDALKTLLERYKKACFNPDWDGITPEACQVALNKYKSFWGPFLDGPMIWHL